MFGFEMLTWVLGMWFVVRPLGNYLARRADAKAAIGPIEEDRLTAAFEILGPERVARGLTATGHGWNDCFLAYATEGEPYGPRPGLRKGWRTNPKAGLPVDLTKALVRAWDRKEDAFRVLASEWVETDEEPIVPFEGVVAISQRGA
jgi:hypothetical protein